MKQLVMVVCVLTVGCTVESTPQNTSGEPDAAASDVTEQSVDLAAPAAPDDTGPEPVPVPDVAVEEPPREDTNPDIHPQLLPICRKFSDGGYDQACDVERALITIGADEPRPAKNHLFPGVTSFNMDGWEWWQKWPGGFEGALFEADQATDAGLKCSVASAMRFAAIIQGAPPEIWDLLETTTWEGRFFNWNDDYSDPSSIGDGEGATLWAWEAHLIKWMSTTNRDGSCYLPTRTLLIQAIKNCVWVAGLSDGVIKNCQAP